MENVQIITANGLPQFAVLPYDEYLSIKARAEGFENAEDFLDARRAEQILAEDQERISLEELKKSLEF